MHVQLLKYICAIVALCVMSIMTTPLHQVSAQEGTYTVDYTFNFYIKPQSPDLDVELDIILTNARTDVYITEYTISFPQNVLFRNLRVTDDDGSVPFVTSEDEYQKRITFKFAEPDEGSYTTNHLKLSYTLEDMHMSKGRMREAILPLLVADEGSAVHATLHLPDGFDSKLSISKPVPSSVGFSQIHWDKTDARSILVAFGESQIYALKLGYSLRNSGITPSRQTIALPPETLFQRVYVKALDPQPHRTFTDDDGNFLAEYDVPPLSTRNITMSGYVEVFVKPQSTLRDYIRQQFETQHNYLLTEEAEWSLGVSADDVPLSDLSTPRDIYAFVTDTLSYAPTRLRTDPSRYGAEKALQTPLKAVCMEYTDVFIALAREKGIPAREIQGFGHSENERIRPQSLVLDELHAWPEYYDKQQEVWVQIDPTWEDTSGIDYFTALDTNHIALAIHGRNPTTPAPAGMYKTARRKDVFVEVSSVKPSAEIHLSIEPDIPSSLEIGKRHDASVTVTNTGNAFVHEVRIMPTASSIDFHSGPLVVTYLAPFESREIPISFTPKSTYTPDETISFTYDGAVLGTHDVRIAKPRGQMMYWLLGGFALCVAAFTFYLIRKARTQ